MQPTEIREKFANWNLKSAKFDGVPLYLFHFFPLLSPPLLFCYGKLFTIDVILLLFIFWLTRLIFRLFFPILCFFVCKIFRYQIHGHLLTLTHLFTILSELLNAEQYGSTNFHAKKQMNAVFSTPIRRAQHQSVSAFRTSDAIWPIDCQFSHTFLKCTKLDNRTCERRRNLLT